MREGNTDRIAKCTTIILKDCQLYNKHSYGFINYKLNLKTEMLDKENAIGPHSWMREGNTERTAKCTTTIL